MNFVSAIVTKLKDEFPKQLKFSIVYWIQRQYKKMYIGQTKRYLHTIANEHTKN